MSSAPLLPRLHPTTQNAFRIGWVIAGTLSTAASVGFASWGGYVGKNTGVNEALPQIVATSLFLVASLGCWYGAYHTRHRTAVDRSSRHVQGDGEFALGTCQIERAEYKRLIQEISTALTKNEQLDKLRSDDVEVQSVLSDLVSKVKELYGKAKKGDQLDPTEAARANLQRQVAELREQVRSGGDLHRQLAEKEEARADLDRQAIELRGKLESLQREHAENLEELGGYKAQVTALQEAFEKEQRRNKQLSGERDELTAALAKKTKAKDDGMKLLREKLAKLKAEAKRTADSHGDHMRTIRVVLDELEKIRGVMAGFTYPTLGFDISSVRGDDPWRPLILKVNELADQARAQQSRASSTRSTPYSSPRKPGATSILTDDE